MSDSYQYEIKQGERPRFLDDGDKAVLIDRREYRVNAERALIAQFVCQRRLFGMVYSRLCKNVFDSLREGGGVFLSGLVPSEELSPSLTYPGDIDLLVLPYQGDKLLVDKALGIEIKIVRASFSKQGKSPNEFGFSQGAGLLAAGFPYAAVIHIVVSDEAPVHSWRRVLVTEIVNSETGEVNPPREFWADMTPAELISRSFGRLRKACPNPRLGFAAVYMNGSGEWQSKVRGAEENQAVNTHIAEGLANYFRKNYSRFLDTPKYPVPTSPRNRSS